jgi:serine/threonine protein kinase/DNA polymerase III delta prime subunit
MTERVGQQLGNYRLLRLLGQGAFAAVYLGEHQYLERPAAIKVLHVRMEAAHQESFHREARTIAKLQHPHIISVYDFGICDQTPYLVMEYTSGGTLRTHHPKGTRLSFEQIVTYVKQITSALDYAHAQHVIHRDIKPENLLLNTKQEVVLSDFGIAVVQQTLDSLSTQSPAGTPLYMAPEQIQRHPCPASDQYALGVMVYEWITGEPPFRGSLYEVFSQHLHEPPPSLRAHLPTLPPAVEDAIFGALAKDPGQRFACVTDFATVLEEAFFATQPLQLDTSVEREGQDQIRRPLAQVAPLPVPSSSQQTHPEEPTQPRLAAVLRIERRQEVVPSVSLQPILYDHTVSKPTRPTLVQTNRQRLLRRVRSFWITGVFEQSLHGAALMALGLQAQPDAVANPWHLVVQQPETAPRPLPAGTHITEVYDAADGELLILGAPGSGKTTLLLELARDLLERAERDEQHPMPVVFNLSSWAMKQQSLVDWLVEELSSKYQVPPKLGQRLIEADQILPLLDGLDEVVPKSRTACLEAINSYRKEHGLLPLVVCSRQADYLAQSGRLLVRSAVVVQPLTPEQVDASLAQAGEPLWALRVALRSDATLQELTSTPLLLSILTLTYHGKPVEDLLRATTLPEQQRQLFEQYVERMLMHRGTGRRYGQEETTKWLSWLARQMKQRNQTIFFLERMQPDWLAEEAQQRSYERLGVRLPAALLGGFCFLLVVGFFLVEFPSLLGGVPGALVGVLISGRKSVSAPRETTERRSHLLNTRSVRNGWWWGALTAMLYVLPFLLMNMKSSGEGDFLPSVLYAEALSGVSGGLAGLLLSVLLKGSNTTIQPTEILTWSWKSIGQSLIRARLARNGLLGGLIIGLLVGLGQGLPDMLLNWSNSGDLSLGLSVALTHGLAVGLSTGLVGGLTYWFLFGMLGGLSSDTLNEQQRVKPNQGIWRSAQNSVLSGLLSGAVSGCSLGLNLWLINRLAYWVSNALGAWLPHLIWPDTVSLVHPDPLQSDWLSLGLQLGLIGGLTGGLLLGGLACLRHGILRLLLWRSKSIPWNYARFLDDAAEHIFLRKVGGGYIFYVDIFLNFVVRSLALRIACRAAP